MKLEFLSDEAREAIEKLLAEGADITTAVTRTAIEHSVKETVSVAPPRTGGYPTSQLGKGGRR